MADARRPRTVACTAAVAAMFVLSGPMSCSHAPLTGAAGAPPAPQWEPAAPPIRPGHPRLWLTPDRIARVLAAAQAGSPRWRSVRDAADTIRVQIDRGNTYFLRNSANIPPLALVYVATGEPRYGRAAISAMLQVARPDNRLTGDDYYEYRSQLPDVAAGFDWCYQLMSADERRAVARWMMDRAEDVWPETTPARARGWAVSDPANNYFYGFLMTWPAALACYGDDPRAQKQVGLARAKFFGLVVPWAADWGKGGIFAEGTSYDSTHYLALILDADRTATGENLADSPRFPFLRDSILWRIHSTTPDMGFHYHFGEHTLHRAIDGRLTDYDRLRMLFAAADISDPTLTAWARYWLDHVQPDRCTWDNTMAWELLFYDDSAPWLDYTAKLSRTYFAPNAGVLLHRSSWQKDAVWWGAWSGRLLESHQDRDVNGFVVFAGGWLLGNTALWSEDGRYTETIDGNNVTVGAVGQQWQVSAGDTGVVRRDSGDAWQLFEGQARGAWRRSAPVTDCTRRIVQFDPGTFVIWDRVAVDGVHQPVTWHLHAREPFMVEDGRWSTSNGSFTVLGETLLPDGARVSNVPVHPQYDTSVSSYRLDAAAPAGLHVTEFLTAFSVAPNGAGAPPAIRIASSDGRAVGAAVGLQLVIAPQSGELTGEIDYRAPAFAARQLLVDLPAHAGVNVTDGHGRAVANGKATAAGSFEFNSRGSSELHVTIR